MSEVGYTRAGAGSGGTPSPNAPRRRRMLWYYSAIIDWMMANPGGALSDCAAHVQKTKATLSAIVNSDMFQAALAERKRQYSEGQDSLLRRKLTEVSIATLDQILDNVKTKKSSIPIESLTRLQDSTLSKLGYGIERKEPVQVNVNQTTQIAVPVSPVDLEEARRLLKQHQQGIANANAAAAIAPLHAPSSEAPKGAAFVYKPEEE